MEILIIIPTLNSFQQLDKCISSLKEQTYKNWNVLFVDGKSTIDHKKWLSELCSKESQFNWIEQNKSNGIFGAMNEGYSYAKENEWVLFWGSDDFCNSKDTFKNLNHFVNEKAFNIKEVDFIVCKSQFISKNGKISRKLSISNSNNNYYISSKEFRKLLASGLTPPHQGVLFGPNLRKKNNDLYNVNFKISADLEYFLRISKIKNLKILHLNLLLVNMGDNGISSKKIFRKFYELTLAYKLNFKNDYLKIILKRYLLRLKNLLTK